jgi:hypothetical protein
MQRRSSSLKGSVPALDLRAARSLSSSPPHPRRSSPLISIKDVATSPINRKSAPRSVNDASCMPQMLPESTFWASLQQWQEIDASDYEGKWFQAFVVARTDQYICVHFVGWEKLWCENIPIKEVHLRIRSRRQDSKTGPLGSQSIRAVKSLYRCGCAAAHRNSMKFSRHHGAGARRT